MLKKCHHPTVSLSVAVIAYSAGYVNGALLLILNHANGDRILYYIAQSAQIEGQDLVSILITLMYNVIRLIGRVSSILW